MHQFPYLYLPLEWHLGMTSCTGFRRSTLPTLVHLCMQSVCCRGRIVAATGRVPHLLGTATQTGTTCDQR